MINETYKSPNFDEREGGAKAIDMLVIHHTNMPTAEEARDRLCCPEAKVSSHYLIDEQGQIFKLVDEEMRAWHAGASFWRGRDSINNYSIGIELAYKEDCNLPDECNHYPKVQMEALANLAQDIVKRYNIAPNNIVGHSDIAPLRKDDPGRFFDWQYLAKFSVGYVPPITVANNNIVARLGDESALVQEFQQKLKDFGYNIEPNGKFDEIMQKYLIAFYDHYYKSGDYNIIDEGAIEVLDALSF